MVKPEDIPHFQQALNNIISGNLLKNVESTKEEVKAKKKREAKVAEGKEEQKEGVSEAKKFKSK